MNHLQQTSVRLCVLLGASTVLLACTGTPPQGLPPSVSANQDESVSSRGTDWKGYVRIPGTADRSGIEVVAYPADGKPGSGTTYRAKTDGQGGFVLSGVPTGSYNLVATKSGTGLSAVAMRVQAATVVNLDLTPAGKIQGKVRLASNSVYGGVLVYLSGTSFSAVTDEEGNYTIENVPVSANGYTLVATKVGFAPYKISGLQVQSASAPTQASDMVLTYPSKLAMVKFVDLQSKQSLPNVSVLDAVTGIPYNAMEFDATNFPGVYAVEIPSFSTGDASSDSRRVRLKVTGYHERYITLYSGVTQVNFMPIGTKLVSVSNKQDGRFDPATLNTDVVLTFDKELAADAVAHLAFALNGFQIQSLSDFSPYKAEFAKKGDGSPDRTRIIVAKPTNRSWTDGGRYQLLLGDLKDKDGKSVDFFESTVVTGTSGPSYGDDYSDGSSGYGYFNGRTVNYDGYYYYYDYNGYRVNLGTSYGGWSNWTAFGMGFDEPVAAYRELYFKSMGFEGNNPPLNWPTTATLSVRPMAYSYWNDHNYYYNANGGAALSRSTFDYLDRAVQLTFPSIQGAKSYSFSVNQLTDGEQFGTNMVVPSDLPGTDLDGFQLSVPINLAGYDSRWRPLQNRTVEVKVFALDKYGRKSAPLTVQLRDKTPPFLVGARLPEWMYNGYWWLPYVGIVTNSNDHRSYGFGFATPQEGAANQYRLVFNEPVSPVTDLKGFKLSYGTDQAGNRVFQAATAVQWLNDRVAVFSFPTPTGAVESPRYLQVERNAMRDLSGNVGPVETGVLANSTYPQNSDATASAQGVAWDNNLYVQLYPGQ